MSDERHSGMLTAEQLEILDDQRRDTHAIPETPDLEWLKYSNKAKGEEETLKKMTERLDGGQRATLKPGPRRNIQENENEDAATKEQKKEQQQRAMQSWANMQEKALRGHKHVRSSVPDGQGGVNTTLKNGTQIKDDGFSMTATAANGKKLDHKAVQVMVSAMRERGMTQITCNGSQGFVDMVWKEAQRQGMQPVGMNPSIAARVSYAATDMDLKTGNYWHVEHGYNRPAPDREGGPQQQAANREAMATVQQAGHEQAPTQQQAAGSRLATGQEQATPTKAQTAAQADKSAKDAVAAAAIAKRNQRIA